MREPGFYIVLLGGKEQLAEYTDFGKWLMSDHLNMGLLEDEDFDLISENEVIPGYIYDGRKTH